MGVKKYSKIMVPVCLGLLVWAFLTASISYAATYRLVTLQYPPYEYIENGIVKGAAAEIVKETFKSMGHDVKIEILPWARSIEMLKKGEADGIFTFFKTPEREDFALFSNEVVILQKISLWVHKDSKIIFNGDLSSLRNYNFGVVRKTSYGDKFDSAVKNGALKVVESYTTDECIKQLATGRIDIWVSNHDGALFELKKNRKDRDVRELVPIIQETPSYVAFSKKRNLEKLRDDFDKALGKLKKSGRYDRILRDNLK